MQMKVNGRQLTVRPSATSIGFLLGPTGYRPLPVSKQPPVPALANLPKAPHGRAYHRAPRSWPAAPSRSSASASRSRSPTTSAGTAAAIRLASAARRSTSPAGSWPSPTSSTHPHPPVQTSLAAPGGRARNRQWQRNAIRPARRPRLQDLHGVGALDLLVAGGALTARIQVASRRFDVARNHALLAAAPLAHGRLPRAQSSCTRPVKLVASAGRCRA
jgi:hypothetical protein